MSEAGADGNRDADVIIVGGGPVGATLALALSQNTHAPLDILVLEAQPDSSARHDTRTLALSHGSQHRQS